MFEDIYGLSCIENQVLAILKERNQKIALAYHDSAMPVHEIFKVIVRHGVKQENFVYLKRVHDLLKELGVIDFSMKRTSDIDELVQEISDCGSDEYILIRVSVDFTKNVLHARGLRKDHFVRINPSKSGAFVIINDIPELSIRVGREQLAHIFRNYYIRIKVTRELSQDDARRLWGQRKYKPEEIKSVRYNPGSLGIDAGERIRDIAGINKILKRRMTEYYGIYTDTSFIKRILPETDKLYAVAEYYVLKKNTAPEKWESILKYLYDYDEKIFGELGEKLRGTDYEGQN